MEREKKLLKDKASIMIALNLKLSKMKARMRDPKATINLLSKKRALLVTLILKDHYCKEAAQKTLKEL